MILRLAAPIAILTSALVASLCGCGAGTVPLVRTPLSTSAIVLQGAVHGGQQPVSGATIQLYAVGSSGEHSPAHPLLTQPVITDAQGGFNITGLYSCLDADVYLAATGGNPGIGQKNPQLALLTALGPCSSLSASTDISVNELTTVAAVSSLAPFMASVSNVGYSPANASAMTQAFVDAAQLVNPSSGTSPGTGLPSGLVVPIKLLDTIADIIAPCINSSGGTAGDGSPCGTLLSLTKVSNGTQPTDTVAALLSIMQNPTHETENLFALSTASSPFQPSLISSPASYEVTTTVPVSERTHLLGEYLLNEGTGNVADDTSGQGNDGTIQGSPAWVQNQGLNFTASFQYVDLPASVNSMQTWQMAVYNPPYSSVVNHVGDAPVYSGINGNPTLLCGTTATLPCFLQSSYITGESSRFFALTDHTEAGPFLSAGWHVVTFVCGNSASPAHILYDAVEVSTYITQGTNTCPVQVNGHLQIGGSTYFQAFWTGRIAGTWLWDTALTVDEAKASAQAALNFMSAKGIPLTYPAVQASTPLVITGLDSRTAGAGAGLTAQTMWPFQMALTSPSYRVINVAEGGQSVYDEINQFNILYALQYQPGTVPVVVIFWGGVNDFGFQTAQQVADNLHLAVTKAHAAGARIILATEISATGKDTIRDELNVILRAQASSWGADNLAELATDPVVGPDGASTNTAYFADGLHPNATAEPHITAIMQNVVNELLGSTAAKPILVGSSSYQEQAGDDYLHLTLSTMQAITLPDCTGYSLPRTILAGNGGAVVSAWHSQTLNGLATIQPGSTAVFQPVPGLAASAGCSWQRTFLIAGSAVNAAQVGI